MAARLFDRIVVSEDKDKRGREPGEMVRLISGAIRDENPSCECSVVLDQGEALDRAIRGLGPDELIVVFYDKLRPVLRVLESHDAEPVSSFEQPLARNRKSA
jgi:cyanophycin synthetase